VVLPSALAGFLLGLLVPGPGTSWAGAAAAASVALVVPTVIAAVTHRRTGGQGREDLVTGRLSPRRLVLETLAVVVAATGVIALRGRGLTTESATQGTDPFVAAVPVLVALAAGLLVLRIYPYPLRAVGVLSRRARSAVPFLGLAGASRQSRGTALPLIVLLMATSVAGFTASVDTGLRRAQTTASWQQVGADGLVTSAALDRASVDRVRKVPGVTDAVPVHTIDGSLTPVSGFPTTVKIVAVDLDGYRKVVAGRPVPVPPGRVLMSERLTSGSIDWAGGLTVPVTKTGTISRFPGVDTDLPLVVVPYASLGGRGDANAFPTGIFVRGSGFTAQALWKAAAPGRPDAEAKTFAEVHHELTRAPLVLLVQQSFAVTALLVGGYGLLALLLTMIISAEARGRTIAYLRTLGLSARQVRRLGLVEVGPVIGSATLAGWAVGLTVPRIIGSAVDLRPYTGGSPVVDFSPDLRSVLLLGGGLLLFGGLALVIDSAVSARRRLDGVLRVGEQ
jgi:putative ABC transport system permease protein